VADATLTQFPLAPGFALADHLGGEFRLRGPRAPGPVVLVFIRGHWCPYCRRYLEKLRDHAPRFAAAGAAVVVVSPEPPATSRPLAEQLSFPFPILADTDGRVIDLYGTRNGFRSARALLPHPSVFIIDFDGGIRFRSIDRNFKKRTTMRTIFGVLEEIGHEAEGGR
jgi:peroxiredoxin